MTHMTEIQALQLAAEVCSITPNDHDFWSADPTWHGHKYRPKEKQTVKQRRFQQKRREEQ